MLKWKSTLFAPRPRRSSSSEASPSGAHTHRHIKVHRSNDDITLNGCRAATLQDSAKLLQQNSTVAVSIMIKCVAYCAHFTSHFVCRESRHGAALSTPYGRSHHLRNQDINHFLRCEVKKLQSMCEYADYRWCHHHRALLANQKSIDHLLALESYHGIAHKIVHSDKAAFANHFRMLANQKPSMI